MGLLTGDLSAKVYKAFKGKLLKGIIRRTETPDSGALDAHGDAIETEPVDREIEGFTENYSDYYRAKAGIPDGDVQVNIFGESVPGFVPGKDDLVMFTDRLGVRWYQLRGAKTDPATALWTCQAFPIKAPA